MYFDDIALGHEDLLGSFTFTGENIRAFAAQYDPQPFHIDEAAAAASHFGGLVASGWQVAAVWMKLMVAYQKRLFAEARAAGRGYGQLGPSPGFREMVWARPVRPGDTLTYRWRISDKKVSASRPGWGIVTMQNVAVNQRDEDTFRFTGIVFWQRRPDGAAG